MNNNARTRTIARTRQHLWRTKARAAWILVLFCSTLYYFIHGEDIRNVLIVLASVAASAIFLPELSSDLWTMKADEVKKAMPERRVRELMEQLMAATTDADWAKYGMAGVLDPFLGAREQPLQVQWNVSYDIHLRLDQEMHVGDKVVRVHIVRTTMRSNRILPSGLDQKIWVSVAQNAVRLQEEYERKGCLLRDLIPLASGLGGEAWRQEILRSCDVNIIVDGRQLSLVTDNYEVADIVRWESEVPEVGPGQPVPVTVIGVFPMDAGANTYPVVFGSYYCAGSTEVTFTVEHDSAKVTDLNYINFCTRPAGGGSSGGELRERIIDPSQRSITFTTGRETLLWPGSGLMLEWKTEAP